MNDPRQLERTAPAPNHHAHHPGFTGLRGLAAACGFLLLGRRSVADLAVRLVDLGPDDDVVDIGCGPGVASRRAAATGASSVVGIDPSVEMLRVARMTSVMPGRGRRTVRFVEGAAEALPRPDQSATVLWSLSTVHHWRDLEAGLAEARRVLRPSGRFLAIERRTTADATGIASHGWTADQAHDFAARCEVSGFRAVVVTEHDIGSRGVHAVLATAP